MTTTTLPIAPTSHCPACSTATRAHRAEHDPGGMRGHYNCLCGRRWWVGWLLSETEKRMYESAAA